MEIITEKISSEPNHSVSKKDIKLVLEIVPDDWVGVAHVFNISAQLFEKTKWDRPVIQNTPTFKIHSRGIEKLEIIKELLIDMAISPMGSQSGYAHSLTKVQRKKIEEFINPYYQKFIEVQET
jgi:hypothetical protein